jgi:outer membrane protein assembly factor BamA
LSLGAWQRSGRWLWGWAAFWLLAGPPFCEGRSLGLLADGELVAASAQGEAGPDSIKREGPLPAALAQAPRAATGQTVEAVRWMAKRRQFTFRGVPYGVTGLPFVYFSPNTGWNYGLRLHWADYQRRPYRYKITLHLQTSSEGKRKDIFRLKVPRISGTGFGLLLSLGLERTLRTRYYGLGNDSRFVKGFVNPKSPLYKDENYYYYVLEESPRFIFSLLREIRGPLSLSMGLGLERTKVEKRGALAYYQDEGTPDGVKDGITGFVSLTLLWDSRDDEVVPREGTFHEWSYESSRNSLLGLFFEEINFRRYTFTDARYFSLSERASFSHRAVLEVLAGEAPLYAYSEIGGSRRVKGLGGSHSLRGFDTQRFTDNVRLFTNAELRYQLHSMWVRKQYLEWQGAFFVDTGRVSPKVDEMALRGLHLTGGAELRLSWDADFMVRLGTGLSSEQTTVWMDLGNAF